MPFRKADGGADDDLAMALGDLRQRRPHGAPDPHQVDLDDPFPFLGRHRPRSPFSGAMPALATTTSSPPKRSTISATAAIIAPWSVTSAAIPIARSPIRSAASRASVGVEVERRRPRRPHVHLAGGLVADPAGAAGDQRDLAVQVVGGHRRGS